MYVGVDAHIDPAVQTNFTEISGKFDGAQWGDVGIAPYAPPPEGFRKSEMSVENAKFEGKLS